MPDNLHTLTSQTLRALMVQLNADPGRKLEVIQRINEVGLVAVIREQFQVTPEQDKFLDQVAAGKNGGKLWEVLITHSLLMDGNLSLVGAATITDVGVHVGTDGVDVSVHC